MTEQMAGIPAECPSCGKRWTHVAPLRGVLAASALMADVDPDAEVLEEISVVCHDCMDSGRWREALAREREELERYEGPEARAE